MEFQVSGQTYKAGKLSAMTAYHVATRWGIVLMQVASMYKTVDGQKRAPTPRDVALFVVTLTAQVPRADNESVLNECLSVVQRQQTGGAWAAVKAGKDGGLMFEDIGFAEMVEIVWNVIQANRIADFFSAPLEATGGQTQASQG